VSHDNHQPDPALLAAIGDGLSHALHRAAADHEAHERAEDERVRGLMAASEARAWIAAWRAVHGIQPYGAPDGPIAAKHWRAGARATREQAAYAVQEAAWRRCGEPHKGWLIDTAVVRGRFWSDVLRLASLGESA